jgi:hypothetical protein
LLSSLDEHGPHELNKVQAKQLSGEAEAVRAEAS